MGLAPLTLLGHPTGVLVTATGTSSPRLRHAEILLPLTLNPGGLTSEQLAIEFHGRRTAPVTLRAELSRLRNLLARHGTVQLASRPYRPIGELEVWEAYLRALPPGSRRTPIVKARSPPARRARLTQPPGAGTNRP